MEFCEPPVARKLAVGHLCVSDSKFPGYWWFQVLSISKCLHGLQALLLLLHSAFILSVVKMLLKGKVGGHVLNSHGIMDNPWNCISLNFCGNPEYTNCRRLVL